MHSAFGCTKGRKSENGRQHCELRNLICPTKRSLSKEEKEMTIDCCCEGSHLCNHDMNSYRAFYSLPIYVKVRLFVCFQF